MKLSSLLLRQGELDQALQAIKECLHNDPEQRECKKVFRRVKKLQKGMKQCEEIKEKRKWRELIDFLKGFSSR